MEEVVVDAMVVKVIYAVHVIYISIVCTISNLLNTVIIFLSINLIRTIISTFLSYLFNI